MNCPMSFNTSDQRDILPCTTNENCAWWCSDKDSGYCAITSIAIDLMKLRETMEAIAKGERV
jgi:hypothetical protein